MKIFEVSDVVRGTKLVNLDALAQKTRNVVIVSFFGKSHYNAFNGYTKAFHLALQSFGSLSVMNKQETCAPGRSESTIEGFYSEEHSVILLHLTGTYNTKSCLRKLNEMSEAIAKRGFSNVWCDLKFEYCRLLYLMFSMSHLIVLSLTDSNLDTYFLEIFRSINATREEMLPYYVKALQKVDGVARSWIENGRMCIPKVLFFIEVDEIPKESGKYKILTELGNGLSELEEKIQDNFYHMFRQCKIIANSSSGSLFLLPSSKKFVFLAEKTGNTQESVNYTTDVLTDIINKTYSNFELRKKNPTTPCFSIRNESEAEVSSVHNFKRFLLDHINVALNKGYDEEGKRSSEYRTTYCVPQLRIWAAAYRKLCDKIFFHTDRDQIFSKLSKYANMDAEYLENQCSAAFPSIYSAYQKGLPEFYSFDKHQTQLTHAVEMFSSISRGTGIIPWIEKLVERCEAYWKKGRQQCESRSLLGTSCCQPLHQIDPSDSLEINHIQELDSSLPKLSHSTKKKILATCNCGKSQVQRKEPFTIKEANYEFYEGMSSECCGKYDSFKFNFHSSGLDARKKLTLQQMIEILQTKSIAKLEQNNEIENMSQATENELRQDVLDRASGEESDEDLHSDISTTEAHECDENHGHEEDFDKRKKDLDELPAMFQTISLNKEVEQNGIDGAVIDKMQSTKLEYLPGMLHSHSPSGLLPLFSSWSMVCLGPSSIYSHHSGVTHQPGFLNGSNSLIPWDVLVKAEAGVRKPIPRFIRGSRPKASVKEISGEFTVKIFFGFEYECKRGHRFMMESPKDVMRVNSGESSSRNKISILKESAAKLVASDMPLFYPCPACREPRDSQFSIGQLSRIHVVSPKAPVYVILRPKVQPGSSISPLFYPEYDGDIKLSPSTYWVLRLPYCYVDDEKVYNPTSLDFNSDGKLLRGLFQVVSMTKEETKKWEEQNERIL